MTRDVQKFWFYGRKSKKGRKYEVKIYAAMPAPPLGAQHSDFTFNQVDGYHSTTRQRVVMSVVWKYSVSDKHIKLAECSACSAEISRRGTLPKHFSMTSLKHHLKTRRPVQYEEYNKTTTE